MKESLAVNVFSAVTYYGNVDYLDLYSFYRILHDQSLILSGKLKNAKQNRYNEVQTLLL